MSPIPRPQRVTENDSYVNSVVSNSSGGLRDAGPTGRKYLVVTPEYGTVVPILDDGSGPMEYGCDVLHVRARNRRAAKVLAVRAWRRKGRYSLWINRNDGNPYVGLKVESAEYPWKNGDMAPAFRDTSGMGGRSTQEHPAVGQGDV